MTPQPTPNNETSRQADHLADAETALTLAIGAICGAGLYAWNGWVPVIGGLVATALRFVWLLWRASR